jgi:hypothetical protein
MSAGHVPRLANLRAGVEQHGSLTGQLDNLLRELQLSRLDDRACAVIADSLTAAGLESTPEISTSLRRNSMLKLTLVDGSPPTVRNGSTSEQHPGTSSRGVLSPFATTNPYLQRLFQHEMFGAMPEGCVDAFRKLETIAPEELLVSALRVRHGVFTEGGFLMITTHWLRYVKHGIIFTAVAKDDFWPLDASLDLQANTGEIPLFVTPDGNQFQIYPAIPIVSRRQAKGFHGIYRLAALAMHHLDIETEDTRNGDAASAEPPSGIVAELKDLVGLRDSGALNETEFETAKARLLGT